MRRIFVAINLPKDIKDELVDWQNKHKNFPVRWTKRDSLHITLCFIGETPDENIKNIESILTEIAKRHKPFLFQLTDISVGPSQKFPRMIWVNGQLTKVFKDLQNDLIDGLKKFCSKDEARDFTPHITLARAKKDYLGKPKKIPYFQEQIHFNFEIKSFELMESILLPDGAEYSILKSFNF